MRPAYIAILASTTIGLTACGQAPKHASAQAPPPSSVAPVAASTSAAAPSTITMTGDVDTSAINGTWSGYDHMTNAVTGDITISKTMITISGVKFPVRAVQSNTDFPLDGGTAPAVVFSVESDNVPVMLPDGNKLAGDDPVQWFVVWKTDTGIIMEAFSDDTQPTKDSGGTEYRYSRDS